MKVNKSPLPVRIFILSRVTLALQPEAGFLYFWGKGNSSGEN